MKFAGKIPAEETTKKRHGFECWMLSPCLRGDPQSSVFAPPAGPPFSRVTYLAPARATRKVVRAQALRLWLSLAIRKLWLVSGGESGGVFLVDRALLSDGRFPVRWRTGQQKKPCPSLPVPPEVDPRTRRLLPCGSLVLCRPGFFSF